jgi:hypothetical protein
MGFLISAYINYNGEIPKESPLNRMDWLTATFPEKNTSEVYSTYGLSYNDANLLLNFLAKTDIPELKLFIEIWSDPDSTNGFIFVGRECLTILNGLRKTLSYYHLEQDKSDIAKIYYFIGELTNMFYNAIHGLCIFL